MGEEVVKKHGLKANFIYNFISQILTLIIPLITTPYLARVLMETGNGQYSYSVSIITFFTLFANLGFDIYGQRQVAACRNDKQAKSAVFWELFCLKSITTIIALAVLASVVFTIGFGENYDKLILILSIQIIAIPFDIQFLYRGDEEFKSIAIRTIIMKLICLVFIFLFVKDSTQTWVYALIMSVSVIASNFVLWISVFKKISFVRIGSFNLLKHIKPTILIFLPTLAVTVYSVFDKTMIGMLAQNPDYENGCYEQAYKINSVALMLVTIISSVMVSRNSHDYERGVKESVKRHIYLATSYVWMIALPLTVGFAVSSESLCYWFLGEGYAEVPLLLKIMSVRFVVSGMGVVFGDQLFIAIKKEKYPTIATIFAAGINVGLNCVLIPRYGAVGAAIATSVCEAAVTLVLAVFVIKGKYVSILKIILSSWKYLVAAAIMFVPLFFMTRYIQYSWWAFLLSTLVGVIVYFVALIALRDKFFIKYLNGFTGAVKRKLKKRENKENTEEVMIKNMTEQQAREKIKEIVAEYYHTFKEKNTDFNEGDRITYAARVYDEKEMCALTDATLDFWLTTGRFADEFEKKFAEWLGVKHAHLVNSGSSANLIAFTVLTAPELKDRQIKRGDEVITVACGFPTTVTPILQYGAVPVFVDVTVPQYNIDVSLLEAAYSEKTKAVMVAHTLGNPFNLKAVKEFCVKRNLWLVEDNCDALGSEYTVDGVTKFTGTWGDIGTSSFYPPHHMTMGEGGCVYTDNPLLNKLILSYRDWGRDCVCPSGRDNFCNRRFDGQYGELPKGYDHKYVYSHFGYNLKVTDMQAAIGCEQLKKFPSFIERRRHNWQRLYSALKVAEDKLILPAPAENSNPSWFGFLISVKPESGLDRNEVTKYIESKNVQTRLLFSGNLIKHPCFNEIRGTNAYRVVGDLKNTDYIMNNTFWVGVYPGMTDAMIDYMAKIILEALK